MSHSFLYRGPQAQLVNQLVYFDEETTNLLNQYFPAHDQKRRLAEKTLAEYCALVERIVHDDGDFNAAALIGSRLKLRFADDDASESFTIVFPSQADPDRNVVSFLSPIGFQLLMARPGEAYTLDIPSGEIAVRVDGVEFVNQGDIR